MKTHAEYTVLRRFMNHPFAMNEARLNQLRTVKVEDARRTLKRIFITVRLFLPVCFFISFVDAFSITGRLDPRLEMVSEDECNLEESDSGYFAVLVLQWMDGGDSQLRQQALWLRFCCENSQIRSRNSNHCIKISCKILLSTWLQQIKIHITTEFVDSCEWKCKIHTKQADVDRMGYCIAREAAIRYTSNEITVRSLALARKEQLICCDKRGFSWGRYYEAPASSGRCVQLTLQWNPTRQQQTPLLWRNKNGFGCRSFRLAMKTRASYVSHLGSERPRYKKYFTQWLYSPRISGDPEPPVIRKI